MHKRAITLLLGFLGMGLLLIVITNQSSPTELLGRILDMDETFRIQVESDFDRDGDIDFLDFTVFSAFYEEAV